MEDLDQDDMLALMSGTEDDAGPDGASPPEVHSGSETTATDLASMQPGDMDAAMRDFDDADFDQLANTFGMPGHYRGEEDGYDSDSRPRDASGGYAGSGSDTEVDEEMAESLKPRPAISDLDVSEMCVVS